MSKMIKVLFYAKVQEAEARVQDILEKL